MKYGEEFIIQKIREFIKKSYDGHYTTTKEGFQAMDIFQQLGIDKDFCHANAIKYLLRYGKKNGKNEEDLYKAIHYIILLISSHSDRGKGNKISSINQFAANEDHE